MNLDNIHSASAAMSHLDGESPIPPGLSFEESLRQMRERRHTFLQRQYSVGRLSDTSDSSVPLVSEGSSPLDEESERQYWKRLSDRRRDSSNHKPLPTVLDHHHHHNAVTEFVEEKLGLKGFMDLNNASFGSQHGLWGNGSHHGNRRTVQFGQFSDQAKQLHYTPQDLHQLIEGKEFSRLQRSLRNKGAVTNEVLRQCLPLVVRQSKLNQERKRRESKNPALLRQGTV
ncbi:expressed unknown protein [Seminavis robusta]|uniref:Uncharacterized protein n=1 Tax=Seminavis robusta TaxID=568900 RepID=A0A9N8EFR1_9STRA|nr:expressed unknown protein [Seminavis robusta]|eukprot:Sro1128_g244290.1 n/a (228) ;mRNA; r:11032-11715